MIPPHGGDPSSSPSPSCIRKIPATSRRSRRPLPGQPFGNMEKSRCNGNLNDRLGDPRRGPNPQKLASPYTSFEGLQFDDSAFESDGHRVGSVVRAQFRKDVLDMALNGLLGDRQLICDQFVCVSRGDQSENFDFPEG